MSRNRWLGLGAVVLLIVVGYFGYQWWSGKDETAEVEQEQVVVSRGTLQESVGGTGAVAPSDEVSLRFATGGLVEEVLVAEGQLVTEGQPLAVLDTRELLMSLDSAEASLTSAESSLASARDSLSDVLDGPDATESEAAKIKLEGAKDALWGRQAQRDGTCGRVENGRGEQYECDSAEASVLQAEGSVRSAQLEYDAVMDGPSDLEITSARDKVAQAEAQVTSAATQRDQARLRLEQATLASPIDGTVTALNLRAGERVGSADAAAVVANLTTRQVVINLDETDIANVEVGTDASIVLDAFPDDELSGSVAAIAPSGETQSGVVLFPVTVSLDDTELPIRPGMTAEVEIITMSIDNVVKIPQRAVISTPRGDFVALAVPEGSNPDEQTPVNMSEMFEGEGGGQGGMFRGEGEGFDPSSMGQVDPDRMAAMRERAAGSGMLGLTGSRMVPVTLGVATGTEVEVISGLSEGDVVLIPQMASGSGSEFGSPPGGEMRMMGGVFRGGR